MKIDKMTQEGVQEIVDRMLLNIYMGSTVEVEVAFATNCLETVLGIDFNEEQEIATYYELIKIIKKKNLLKK